MNYILTDFEPQNVLRHFEDICSIPHGSGNEKALSEHIMALAKANGLYAVMDASNNVFVRVPASAGMENAPTLLLQGHLDMVCVHRPELDIDMKTTPVKLVLDGNILRADGTSLGADNGDGISF
nr:aminoacyl-histidine dipeptidase [Clostridia bacterium]